MSALAQLLLYAPDPGTHSTAGPGLPQLDFTTWPGQVFWLCVSFILLYAATSVHILPTVQRIFEKRLKAVADERDATLELEKEIDRTRIEKEKKLGNARNQALQMQEELLASLQIWRDERNVGAQEKIRQLAGTAQADIAAWEQESREIMRQATVTGIGVLMEKMIQKKEPDPAIADAMHQYWQNLPASVSSDPSAKGPTL